MNVESKNVLVIGLGSSGQAAARLMAAQGASVVCVDEKEDEELKKIRSRLKGEGIEAVLGCRIAPVSRHWDLAVLSPGIDPARPLVEDLRKRGIAVIGELEAGYLFCRSPLIALTGTNGKTTTTELIDCVLQANGRKSAAVGNIGTPLSEICLLKERYDVLVVEVSSFQLETIQTFRPEVSLLMNITPDHFDRYPGLEPYARAKARLWENQRPDDWAIVNTESAVYLASLGLRPRCKTFQYALEKPEGGETHFWCDGPLIHGRGGALYFDMRESRLRGLHNAENVMATLAVAEIFGLDPVKTLAAIRAYRAQPHRLETVRIFKGVEYVDDSKATNIDAMQKALTAFEKPIVLIAGGKDKGFDFSTVTPMLKQRVKLCLLIGDMAARMNELWSGQVRCRIVTTLEGAVTAAFREAAEGDVVMLSPGCSSYDQFRDYEHRGEVFRELVNALK